MNQFTPPLKLETVTCGSVWQFIETKILKDKNGKVSNILHFYKKINSRVNDTVISPYTEKEITDYIRKDIFKIVK